MDGLECNIRLDPLLLQRAMFCQYSNLDTKLADRLEGLVMNNEESERNI